MSKLGPGLVFLAAVAAAAWSARPDDAATPCCTVRRFAWREARHTVSGPSGDARVKHAEGMWGLVAQVRSLAWMDRGKARAGIYVTQQGADQVKVVDPCRGWRYRWFAGGWIQLSGKASARDAALSESLARASWSARLEGDLDVLDAEVVAASSSGSGETRLQKYKLGVSGRVEADFVTVPWADGVDARHRVHRISRRGAGSVVQVVMDQRADVLAEADGPPAASWLPHACKSWSSSRASGDVVLSLAVFCQDPSGATTVTAYASRESLEGPGPPRGAGVMVMGTQCNGGIIWGCPSRSEPAKLGFTPPPKPEFKDPDGDGWYER